MVNDVCAVYGCYNTNKNENTAPSRSFFKMPTNIVRLKKWILACGRWDLNVLLSIKDVNYLHDNYVVCSDHFEVHCFRNLNLHNQSLYPDAIPTLNLPGVGAIISDNSSSSGTENCLKVVTICNICLSTDRELHPMYSMIIPEEWTNIGLNARNGVLCWECKAFIKKVSCFKTKALLAQQVLNGTVSGSNVGCLSSLGNAINKRVVIFTEETNPIGHHEKVDVIGEELKVEVATSTSSADEDVDYDEFETDIKDNFVGVQNNTDLIVNIKEEPVNEDEMSVQNELEEKDDLLDNDVGSDDVDKIVKKKANKIKNTRKHVDTLNSYVVCKLNEEELINHREKERIMMRCSKNMLKCESCILSFRNVTIFNKHITQFHSEESGSYVCHICACCFPDQQALKCHTENHNTMYKCALCKHARFYSRLSNMKSHIKTNHGNDYVCKICEKVFSSRISMIYHYKTHNTKECPECGKTVICLKSHMESHDTSPHECTICHKYLKSRKSLWCHMLSHTNTNKDEAYCAECDIYFKNKYLYHDHLKYTITHANADKECDYCHKRFTRKFALAKHISVVHYNKLEYRCPTCQKLFKSRATVNRHVKYVHNKTPMSRKYECIVCDRKFTIKRLLNNHMNSHTGNRPYKCDLCESAFGQSGALYKHKQLVHKIVKTKS